MKKSKLYCSAITKKGKNCKNWTSNKALNGVDAIDSTQQKCRLHSFHTEMENEPQEKRINSDLWFNTSKKKEKKRK